MTSQKYSRAALLRLASKYCFLSGSRGNYRIHTFDAARGCYRETPSSDYAAGVGWIRANRIAYIAGLLGLSDATAYKAQGAFTRIGDAVDYLLAAAGDLAQNDKRYSVELEHCGRAK
ncbi:MAG TPA: hypothetical protein VFM46_01490, partial [Pseudomonadales bacterium]|nr:hypothetical protein [Pseudomonadales bacterium]